jgi:hypothetical protein
MTGVTIQLRSTITCPHCGGRTTEAMEENACRYFYPCPACGVTLTPRPGDCCVFCSYGDVPCPPVQTGNTCCGSSDEKRVVPPVP